MHWHSYVETINALRQNHNNLPTQAQIKAQQHADTMRDVIQPLLAEQYSLSAIADNLNEQGFKTQTGKRLSKTQVSRIIQRLNTQETP